MFMTTYNEGKPKDGEHCVQESPASDSPSYSLTPLPPPGGGKDFFYRLVDMRQREGREALLNPYTLLLPMKKLRPRSRKEFAHCPPPNL